MAADDFLIAKTVPKVQLSIFHWLNILSHISEK